MKTTWKRRLFSLLLSAALLSSLTPAVLAAEEGGGDGSDGGGQPTEQYDLTVTPTDVNELVVDGDSQPLTVSLELDGTPVTEVPDGMEIVWDYGYNGDPESSPAVRVTQDPGDPFKATVSALRLLTSQEELEDNVVVTVQLMEGAVPRSNQGRCEIRRITAGQPTGMSIRLSGSSNNELEPDSTGQMIASFTPEGAAEQTITWTSDSPDIVSVDRETGEVKAGDQPGTATITGRASGGMEETCTITVRGIIITDSENGTRPVNSFTFRENQNGMLYVRGFGDLIEAAADRSVAWSCDPAGFLTVDQGFVYPEMPTTSPVTVTARVAVNSRVYEDSCSVTITSNQADPIPADAQVGDPLSFSSISSDLDSECRSVLGGSLSYIGSVSVPTSQGTLYYRYQSESDTGAGVGAGDTFYRAPRSGQWDLDDLTFVPNSDFSGTAVISYIGYASGGGTFQGTIEVDVEAPDGISYTTSADQALQLSADDFSRVCRDQTGRELRWVMFSQPDSSRGTLYYHYISESNPGTQVDPSREYRLNGTPSLSEVYFVPDPGFTGQAVISYTACDVNGVTFRGRVTVRVNEPAGGTGDLSYSISQGGRITFDDDDFDDLCRDVTGSALDYVRFELPSAGEGSLYYNYTSSGNRGEPVDDDDSYYMDSSPYLRRVTFVADEDFTGTAEVEFTAWDTRGNRFSGVVEIRVGSSDGGDIRYSVRRNGSVTFDDADFNALCRDVTGSTLDYVRFELPRSSQGDLYYNYDEDDGDYDHEVRENRNYYYGTRTYRLDRVAFVPDEDYTGTVEISFRGESVDDESFTGTVVIRVEDGGDAIRYQVRAGDAVEFDVDDFDDLCQDLTGDRLRYVRFTLPSSSRGVLYYEYDGGDYTHRVTSSRSYYRSSSPYLDRVSFEASRSYQGTVRIQFTGRSTGNESFEGEVEIEVEGTGSSNLSYTTSYSPVTFRVQDFEDACQDAGLDDLDYVRFTPPGSSAGHLYYRYDGVGGSASEVRSSTNYYPSRSPRIAEVSFVPRVGYLGTVSIPYTARDERGETLHGQVRITVQNSGSSRHFTDMGSYGWAASAVDFLYENEVVSGVGAGQFGPDRRITRGDFVLMLCQAFDLSGRSGSGFWDVPADSYYAQAVSTAQALGVAGGYPDGGFHPMDPVSRQDAAVMLLRAMQANGWSLGSGNQGLLDRYTDSWQIDAYARDALALMLEYGIMSGTQQNTISPLQTTTRAEMAVMLASALTI